MAPSLKVFCLWSLDPVEQHCGELKAGKDARKERKREKVKERDKNWPVKLCSISDDESHRAFRDTKSQQLHMGRRFTTTCLTQ